jgi:hypothetical protein
VVTNNPNLGLTLIATYTDSRLQIVTRYANDDSVPDSGTTSYYREWNPNDYPTLSQMTLTTNYSLYQRRNTTNDPIPAAPTNSELDNDSYLYYQSSDRSLRVASTVDIEDTIITNTLTEMKSGDEVGSFRVATTTPTVGSSSDWHDLGVIYKNTLYNNVINYRLYIRYRNSYLESQPQNVEIMRLYPDLDDSFENAYRIRGNTIDNFVQGILLNILERNYLTYNLRTSSLVSGDINRGLITDTSYSGSTYDIGTLIPGGTTGYYKRTDYPNVSSSVITRATYYFVITP